MSTKLFRFIAALAVIASVIGNSGVVRADRGTPPGVGSRNLKSQGDSGLQPFTIPAAGSIGIQFVHIATTANIDAHTTIIDHPLTNGNAGALLIVTPNWTPGGVNEPYSNHHIGVFYNFNKSQWGIYNEDGAAMSVGNAFNVMIATASYPNASVQFAGVNSSSIAIDNPLTNNNPNAVLLVTPIWNPGGGTTGTDANFPISVTYNNIINKWTIFNQNGVTLPTGAAFNVFIPTAGAGVFVHTAITNGTGSVYTLIDNPLTNGHPNAIVFVTPNLNPGGLLDEHPTGVFYGNGYWKIFNRDGSNMPVNTAFNVLVLVPRSDIFVHTATTGNSLSNFTIIDHTLTNSHPNAIIFATPNLNPGGGSGTYDNHNFGVTYNGSQWRIFNQNGSSIPVNGAFNVLVPNPDASVFVHTATAGNSAANYTILDNPLTNGNPNAIILVTQNYNPGNVGGSSDDHPIGVEYVSGHWNIYNQDNIAMPPGAAFNVYVPTAGSGVEVFVHTATGSNSGANFTILDNTLANINPNAIVLVTPAYNPGGACACVNANFPIGVGFVGDVGLGHWAIINQNGPSSSIPLNATFNVYIFANYKVYLPKVVN
jgi:hypothetical protein